MFYKINKNNLRVIACSTKKMRTSNDNEIVIEKPSLNITDLKKLKVVHAFNTYDILEKTEDEIKADFENEFRMIKNAKLKALKNITKKYILFFYPYDKQHGDRVDSDYALSAIAMIYTEQGQKADFHQLYVEVGQKVNMILDENKTLAEVTDGYEEPALKFWIQAIKAGVRISWVERCKYVYRPIAEQIKEASDMETLVKIQIPVYEFYEERMWAKHVSGPQFPEFPYEFL